MRRIWKLVCLIWLLAPAVRPAMAADAAVSTGYGQGILQNQGTRGYPCPDGFVLVNSDGSYENAVAWQNQGIAPPYYGAFAEEFDTGGSTLCGLSFDFTRADSSQVGGNMDVYIWDDAGGEPGPVLSMVTGVSPDPIAVWPEVSRHYVDFPVTTLPGPFWAGYWGDWPDQEALWYIAADYEGPHGNPMTLPAPGLGYPSGWMDAAVVWPDVEALGIGVVSQELNVFGNAHLPIGDARLWKAPGADSLEVTNFGSDGSDGVTIVPPGYLENEDFEILSPSFNDENVGGTMTSLGIGVVDGQPDQTIVEHTFSVLSPTDVVETIDLSMLAPQSITAIVYREGALQDSFPNLPIRLVATWTRQSGGITLGWSHPYKLWGSWYAVPDVIIWRLGVIHDEDGNILFTLPDDNYHIYFEPRGVGRSIDDYQRTELRGRDLTRLVITDERFGPILPVTGVGPDEPGAPPVGFGLTIVNPVSSGSPLSLSYTLPEAGPVRLSLFDPAGRMVTTLVNEEQGAGAHQFRAARAEDAKGRPLASGVYLVRIEHGGQSQTGRLTVVR